MALTPKSHRDLWLVGAGRPGPGRGWTVRGLPGEMCVEEDKGLQLTQESTWVNSSKRVVSGSLHLSARGLGAMLGHNSLATDTMPAFRPPERPEVKGSCHQWSCGTWYYPGLDPGSAECRCRFLQAEWDLLLIHVDRQRPRRGKLRAESRGQGGGRVLEKEQDCGAGFCGFLPLSGKREHVVQA